jgi:hypothetical protein
MITSLLGVASRRLRMLRYSAGLTFSDGQTERQPLERRHSVAAVHSLRDVADAEAANNLRSLRALLAPSSETETANFVDIVLEAPAADKNEVLTVLSQLDRTHIELALHTATSRSAHGLDFLYDIRRLCAARQSRRNPAEAGLDVVDGACCHLLKLLHSPQLLHCQQLSLASQHAELLTQAKRSETVQRAASDGEFAVKFGVGRRVHAMLHCGAPATLLAILYSAVMPCVPSSMREIDCFTGTAEAAGLVGAGAGSPTTTSAAPGSWELSPATLRAMTPPRSVVVFYSVSTPHPATKGLKLGTRIIYDVAAAAARAAPELQTFCTLSPIPGFVQWLGATADVLHTLLSRPHIDAVLQAAAECSPLLAQKVEAAKARQGSTVSASGASDAVAGAPSQVRREDVGAALVALLATPTWYGTPRCRALLREPLTRLCQHYMLLPTRLGSAPSCRVAAFHLGNGASMGRILWGADESADGLLRSASLMINYVYSRSGLEGLAYTMGEGAAHYARSPGEVLRSQRPEVVDSLAGWTPQAEQPPVKQDAAAEGASVVAV